MITWLLIGFIVLTVGRFLVKFRKLQKKMPPGPTPLPLLGNILMLRGISNNTHDELNELSVKYGPIMTFWLAYRPSVLLSSVDLVRDALVSNPQQFADRPDSLAANLLLRGKRDIVFSKYGTFWQQQKKFAGQAIRRIIDRSQLEDNVNDTVAEIVEQLKKQGDEPVDLLPYTTNIIYNVITSFCFGTRYSLTDERFVKLLHLSKSANDLTTELTMLDFLPEWPFLIALVSRLYRPVSQLVEIMDEYDEYLRGEYREHKEKRSYQPGEISDFVDAILAEQESIKADGGTPLSDNDIMGIMLDIFMAGTETSAATLSWFFLFMILNPEVQEECYQEIKEVLGNSPPSLADRPKLPYVEACLLETLRRRPIAPLSIPHAPVQETTFSGYCIPENTVIFINMVALHNDPKVWKRPHEFDPHNFLDDETGQVVKPQGFVPFGVGRRVCLGETLAKNDMFLVVTGLLQKLKFKPVDSEEYTIKSSPNAELFNLAMPFKVGVEPR